MIVTIVSFLIFGALVGLIARFLMPGSQSMGLLGTALLGIAGSFIGGVLSNLAFSHSWDNPSPAGIVGSVLGSLLLLFVFGRSGRTQLL
jgi:uncharacterized membrane protein YeaQ/YmgE (transglycosylase-associated protein family)